MESSLAAELLGLVMPSESTSTATRRMSFDHRPPLGCGKMYSAIGRLRRHLVYSEKCLRDWGVFHPATAVQLSTHPQAPPLQAPHP